ncbi:hypothetical protein AM593_05880, partial [Mytilus galloprovincialis]
MEGEAATPCLADNKTSIDNKCYAATVFEAVRPYCHPIELEYSLLSLLFLAELWPVPVKSKSSNDELISMQDIDSIGPSSISTRDDTSTAPTNSINNEENSNDIELHLLMPENTVDSFSSYPVICILQFDNYEKAKCVKGNNFLMMTQSAVISFDINIDSINGETVLLPCKNKQGTDLVQWTRRDKNTEKSFTTVYTDGWRINTGLRLHERLMINGSRGGQDYGLQISNVTMLDSGLYRCAVDTITNLTYFFVTLKIEDKYEDLRTHSIYTVINTTFPFMENTDESRFNSSIPIVSILSIPPMLIVIVLAMIAAIILFQTRRKNKVSSSQVNNQPAEIEVVQQTDHYYD